jgi:hypothetical protein
MAVQEQLRDIIHQHIGPLKMTPSGWRKRNCMLCHTRGHGADKRERFGYFESPDGSITVNCFNCGFMTGWKPHTHLGKKMAFFLRSINVPQSDIDALRFAAFREANDVETKAMKLTGSITKKWTPVTHIPKDLKTITEWANEGCEDKNFLRVVEYADKRGILNPDKLCWSPDKENFFDRRLTIPYYYNDELVGWTGRVVIDTSKDITKYHTHMPPQYIYGLDEQRDYDKQFIIISEGIIDAFITDGIGVLHNKLHENQAALINALPGTKILCPDRDKDGDGLIETAIENKWSVAFPKWGKDSNGRIIKDAGHAAEVYGHLLTIQSIIESRERDSYNIRIKRKMDKMNNGY